MAAKRLKKAEQTEIPGTERKVYKDVAKAAAELYDVRAQRMELSEEEGRQSAVLLEMMRKHGLKEYVHDDMVVTVVTVEERVRVKKKRDAAAED